MRTRSGAEADVRPVMESCEGRTLLSGSVQGHLFDDVNHNGARDAGEAGFAGVKVRAIHFLQGGGIQINQPPQVSTTTDADGAFSLPDLPSAVGPWTLQVIQTAPVLLSGRHPGGDPFAGLTEGVLLDAPSIAFTNNGAAQQVDFPASPHSIISGRLMNATYVMDGMRSSAPEVAIPLFNQRVYIDVNDNGKRDRGEPMERTNLYGEYVFDNAPLGPYVVRPIVPKNMRVVSPLPEGFATRNLLVHHADLSLAAPFTRTRGLLYSDGNGNGRRDRGEAPLTNRKLIIDLDGDGVWDRGESLFMADMKGRFRLDGYLFGKVTVSSLVTARLVKQGFRPQTFTFEITEADKRPINRVQFGVKPVGGG
jgi:hypothetical protein